MGGGPGIHLLARVARLGMVKEFFPAGSLLVRPGRFGPNALVAMDFRHEDFPVPVQRVEEPVVAAIAAVHAHQVERDAELALVADALQGDFRFGLKMALILGDAGFVAALGIVAPNLGQVEPNVGEGGLLAAGKAGADGDLAVFNLAEPPVGLPRHADGAVALFPEAGVVDDEPAARGSAEQPAGPAGDLVHERTVVPRRVADGIVNRLIVEIRHVFLHALEILRAALGLHQAEQIAVNLGSVAVTASVEETGEILDEGHKAASGSDDVL